ncbi:MAG: UDP-N-acetylmuramoyl-L-alanine--D-glutamate ligase [Candidatus Omnitrophica bacterium]|nr:UDP-N-acetylmuramoyl-L-alanine--D-glutamate ligase [Candidatus Omnitrophota bacterium]
MRMAAGAKVAVLGLRDTGFLSALYLHEKGYHVFASDLADTEDVRGNVAKLVKRGIRAECGKHSFDAILASDGFLVSPGIPPGSKIYQAILATKKPIHSEIEVASWFSPAKTVVAITGSCGKTTTATLIAQIVETSGRKAVLCGNIGNPWIGEIPKITSDTVVVLEVSSFQLMHCTSFAPSVGLLLNVFPNHMDWHVDMKEYAGAKLNLFRAMKNTDVMICRKKDEADFFPDFQTAARRVYFDERPVSNPNEAALLCVAEALKCPEELVGKAILNFRGIEHRLEKFAERDGIVFINDSKATTTASLAWALEKYGDGTVVLVCGGKYKTGVEDFKNLRAVIAQKVRCAVLIGAARPIMKEAWQGTVPMVEAGSLDEACRLSLEKAQKGDTVLLSPACASFDMFKNYQERGRLFKQMIKKRLQSCGLTEIKHV